jgi:rhodanese-related sulfurtransferase
MKLVSAALALALVTTLAASAGAASYRYMPAAELERRLKAKEPVVVLDIQVEPEYREHRIKGAKPTYAYPVKSPEDKAKLEAALKEIASSKAPVVIVCPRGAGGAERTVDYFLEKGVSADRLYILEKGQAGWSCAELTERG